MQNYGRGDQSCMGASEDDPPMVYEAEGDDLEKPVDLKKLIQNDGDVRDGTAQWKDCVAVQFLGVRTPEDQCLKVQFPGVRLLAGQGMPGTRAPMKPQSPTPPPLPPPHTTPPTHKRTPNMQTGNGWSATGPTTTLTSTGRRRNSCPNSSRSTTTSGHGKGVQQVQNPTRRGKFDVCHGTIATTIAQPATGRDHEPTRCSHTDRQLRAISLQ